MASTHARTIDYWSESRRPLASLAFLLPVLAVYEVGLRSFERDQLMAMRNGADTWMRAWLMQIGIELPWMLPVIVISLLLGWHLVMRYPWRVSVETLIGMASESLLGAIVLLVMGQMLSLSFHAWSVPPSAPLTASIASPVVSVVGFLGAGVYEEVLFRLFLLPFVYWGLRLLLVPRGLSAGIAIVGTSVLFSLAHYVEPGPECLLPSLEAFVGAGQRIMETPDAWFGCGFRFLAGLLFAIMFLYRGFGITVGCHALYDLLVGVLILPEG